MKSYKLKAGLGFAVIPGVGRVRDQILVGDYDKFVPALLEVVPSEDGGTASVAPVVSTRAQPAVPVPPPIAPVPVVPAKEEEPKPEEAKVSEEPKVAEEPKSEEPKPAKGKKGRHE